jgi:hypothetical protein
MKILAEFRREDVAYDVSPRRFPFSVVTFKYVARLSTNFT